MRQKNSVEQENAGRKWTSMRKWCRDIHRHLSFFFAGVICIYAVSGICLNHKRDFNSNISIQRYEIPLEGNFPMDISSVDKDALYGMLEQLPAKEDYTRHAPVGENGLKVFFKGGSAMEVNLENGTAMYEKVRRVPVLSSFNRLHYNPSRWWTLFSDIFAVCLLLITLTGMLMMKGRRGFWGLGGVEFAVGVLVPLLFMFLL